MIIMGQWQSLGTSTGSYPPTAVPCSQRRSAKRLRESVRVQKAEDVPEYRGSLPLEDVVNFVNGLDSSSSTKLSVANSISSTRKNVLVCPGQDSKDRRQSKQLTKTKAIMKRDLTESDSGCGDCLISEHQKDMRSNSVETLLQSGATLVYDTNTTIQAADCSLLESASCLNVSLKHETLAVDTSSKTEQDDEFVTVNRRRRVTKKSKVHTSGTVSALKGGKFCAQSNLASNKQAKTYKRPVPVAIERLKVLPVGLRVDVRSSTSLSNTSEEPLSSYASATSSVRSSSPLESDTNDAGDTPRLVFNPDNCGPLNDYSVFQFVDNNSINIDMNFSHSELEKTFIVSECHMNSEIGITDSGYDAQLVAERYTEILDCTETVTMSRKASMSGVIHNKFNSDETVGRLSFESQRLINTDHPLGDDSIVLATKQCGNGDNLSLLSENLTCSYVDSNLQSQNTLGLSVNASLAETSAADVSFGCVDFSKISSRRCALPPKYSSSRYMRHTIPNTESLCFSVEPNCASPVTFSDDVSMRFRDTSLHFGFDCNVIGVASMHVDCVTVLPRLSLSDQTLVSEPRQWSDKYRNDNNYLNRTISDKSVEDNNCTVIVSEDLQPCNLDTDVSITRHRAPRSRNSLQSVGRNMATVIADKRLTRNMNERTYTKKNYTRVSNRFSIREAQIYFYTAMQQTIEDSRSGREPLIAVSIY